MKKARLQEEEVEDVQQDLFSEGLFDVEATATPATARRSIVQAFAQAENDLAVVRSPAFRNFLQTASGDELKNLRDDLEQQGLTGGYVVHPEVLLAIQRKADEVHHMEMVVRRKLYKPPEARFRPSGKNYKRPPP